MTERELEWGMVALEPIVGPLPAILHAAPVGECHLVDEWIGQTEPELKVVGHPGKRSAIAFSFDE